MPLRSFCFPIPETRVFKADSFIYKFRIRGGNSYSGEEVIEEECFNQELEEIIRTVLGNLDSLQPFSTTHYIVFPYKKRWESVCEYRDNLSVYPFILTLYLERNMHNAKQAKEKEAAQHEPCPCEPQLKRRKTDSPLEDAIVKDLTADMEAESSVSIRSKVDRLHTQWKVKERLQRVDKRETREADKLLQESGVSLHTGSPGGATQDTVEEEEEGEEEEEEEEEEEKEEEEKPGRRGILTQLASYIFPFSLFFKDP